jgi:hypothetical protein
VDWQSCRHPGRGWGRRPQRMDLAKIGEANRFRRRDLFLTTKTWIAVSVYGQFVSRSIGCFGDFLLC